MESRIPQARNVSEVTLGFLRCREARVTVFVLIFVLAALFLWGARQSWSLLLLLPGLLLWYLVEIPIHRWVLHAPLPRQPLLRCTMERLHYRHHQRPTDPGLLFLPEWVSVPAIALLLAVAAWSGYFAEGLWFVAGFCVALTSYEWMHYAVHSRWRPGWEPLKRTFDNHMSHHFRNENYWFGVSNTLMDKLWCTAPDPRSVPRSATARSLKGESSK